MTPYRTLFTGTLIQESAASIGGNDDASAVDGPFCRNGKGHPTLTGGTLAGALIATARKIYGHIPDTICQNIEQQDSQAPQWDSVWRVFNAHPKSSPGIELRQGVGIRQATGAAAGGVLFDIETLPRGTEWDFVMEVDITEPEACGAEAIAAAALLEWGRGRCWIGRSVSRGLGWMRLIDLKARVLTLEQHLDKWPNSEKHVDTVIGELDAEPIDAQHFPDAFRIPLALSPWHYLVVEGNVVVGESSNGYGLDAISLGGHIANAALAKWNPHYLRPKGQKDSAIEREFNSDFSIVLTVNGHGELEPFIPGSGLRGTIRHALSRWFRARGQIVRDPNVEAAELEGQHADAVEQIFGTIKNGAALLVRDAYLLSPARWTAAWVQHHAEDEFSGGVYGTNKFDRVALIEGIFEWKIVIEAETKEACTAHWESLKPVFKLAECGHLPVGGGQWRGFGWPRWEVTREGLGIAGRDALEPFDGRGRYHE